ncbi:MAG: hypothetical protein WBL53_14060 [Pseudonocardiaceae bacterium]
MTDVGALPNDWATDPVALARVLARLREWDPEPRRNTRLTAIRCDLPPRLLR